MEALYEEDRGKEDKKIIMRIPLFYPCIKNTWEKLDGDKAHQLFHTHYTPREKI